MFLRRFGGNIVELSLVVLSIAFCVANWIFFGSGHCYMNFINKEKYQIQKAINILFSFFCSLVMTIILFVGYFIEIGHLTTILIILLSIDFFVTVLHICILDIIGLKIRNSKIRAIILYYLDDKDISKQQKSFIDLYTQCRNYPRGTVEKIYTKLLKKKNYY